MGGPVIPRQPDLLIQLRRTQHAVRTRLDTDLAETGLTTPQYTVLAVLERESELSASDLGRELGMTAQTMNVITAAIITAGTKYDATTSTRRWIGARLRWASLTMRTI